MPQPPAIDQGLPVPPLPPIPPDINVQVPEGAPLRLGPLAGVPQTVQELDALRERRGELSDQLISATNRRDELAEQMEGASGANRVGLEQRLQVLDARIVQLETDMAETGRQLAAAPPHLLSSSSTSDDGWVGPGGLENGQITAISIVGILFIGFPIAIAMARLMWKRAVTPAPRLPQETTQRMQRMEQAVDAIAIEMERVSEGQRFLTRLFAGAGAGGAPALGVGQQHPAEQPRAAEAEGARVPHAGA